MQNVRKIIRCKDIINYSVKNHQHFTYNITYIRQHSKSHESVTNFLEC